MSLKINNDTANGSATLQPSNTATGDVVHTLPAFTTELAPRMQLMEAKTASGTSVDFDGIPAWAKKITVMFYGVSLTGTSTVIVQVGTSLGILSSGYDGSSTRFDSTLGYSAYSSGFTTFDGVGTASDMLRGKYELIVDNLKVSETHHLSTNSATSQALGAGDVSIPDTLTTVRITTVNGTDTFDAGLINILVEG